MIVHNDVLDLVTETLKGLIAERDALRFTVDTLRLEVDALQKREAERIRFQGLSRREQRQHQLQVLSEMLDQLTQLQNEVRAELMPVER
jgi:hypothetical protein